MNRHVLRAEMATSEALKPAAMTTERVAEIQLACEAVATYANLYRATPLHPAVADYRSNRFDQFTEAYEALKGLIDA